jgi:3-oxoacid CoA-transferase subunit A
LLDAMRESGVKDLTFASNNAGIDNEGIGKLLDTRQVKKMISSYVGENKEFDAPVSVGRAGGGVLPAGHAGRADARGRRGHPRLLHQDRRRHGDRRGQGSEEFDGRTYILERGIVADLRHRQGLEGRRDGNVVFRKTARNFNVPAATCGKVCVVEVEEIVPRAARSRRIHLPGVYVQRLILGRAL